jgi:trehalose 6-phosphate synthase
MADSIRSYTSRVLAPWAPVIVSNRAPFEPHGRGAFRKGAGGVATALLSMAQSTDAAWVACARTDRERDLATGVDDEIRIGRRGESIRMHYATPTAAQYFMYYSIVANPLLWFIQHYLWDVTYEPIIDERYERAWTEGYTRVNIQMAEVAARVARRSHKTPLIFTQDYQLYLAPRWLRHLVPEAVLQQFIHIPWPTPEYWKILPQPMRDAILDGLLANDIVGFQTTLDVRNFLMTCEENMGLRVDHRERSVLYRGGMVWVRSYPISVDAQGLEQTAESPEVKREEDRIRQWRPEKLILRVDRTDPSKNVVRGFLGYERMLRKHPELAGRVQFYAFLQPSRQDVPAYKTYLRRIHTTVSRINRELGRGGWEPIRLDLGENFRQAVAGYLNFDVLLVNSIYDGMNLVAKEGMLLNRNDGVLVLSENAGAYEEMGQHALAINPFDVDATADALYRALTMGEAERRRRIDEIRMVVRINDIERWITRQIQDVRDLVGLPRPRAFSGIG